MLPKINLSPPPDEKIHHDSLFEVDDFYRAHPDIATPLPFIDISRLLPDSPLLKPFKVADTWATFRSFQNNAPGGDTIRKIHIEHFPKLLFVIITKLYNYCLSTGYYPTAFKQGIVVWILKPGKDPSDPANYRPVTLLNLLGKGFGKMLNARFVFHMETRDLYSPLQYGFRKGRGTTSSLALLYETIAREKGNSRHRKISIVSTDISGAFDRVWHQKLVFILHQKLHLPELFVKYLQTF